MLMYEESAYPSTNVPTLPVQSIQNPEPTYAIGPIDQTHLHTICVPTSEGTQIALLVPATLPPSVLYDPAFCEAYAFGYETHDTRIVYSVLQVVNNVAQTLSAELDHEWNAGVSLWITGFLLGELSCLAETDTLLARVGIAHLCFFLPDPLSPPSCRALSIKRDHHENVLSCYQARVLSFLEQDYSFQDAQRLAFVGEEQHR